MSETLQLLSEPSEDPFPSNFANRLSYPIPEPELPGTLGELVVNDSRDPFTWLSDADRKNFCPSEAAKNVMWMLYRMSGNFPLEDSPVRGRDGARIDRALKRLDGYDCYCIDLYLRHLVSIEAEESARLLRLGVFINPLVQQ
jgi:hypothetical protein